MNKDFEEGKKENIKSLYNKLGKMLREDNYPENFFFIADLTDEYSFVASGSLSSISRTYVDMMLQDDTLRKLLILINTLSLGEEDKWN